MDFKTTLLLLGVTLFASTGYAQGYGTGRAFSKEHDAGHCMTRGQVEQKIGLLAEKGNEFLKKHEEIMEEHGLEDLRSLYFLSINPGTKNRPVDVRSVAFALGEPKDVPQAEVPVPQAGYPGVQSGYPGAQAGHPGAQSGYPGAQSGYPGAQSGYPGAQSGYPGAQSGYPGAQSGYPRAQAVKPKNLTKKVFWLSANRKQRLEVEYRTNNPNVISVEILSQNAVTGQYEPLVFLGDEKLIKEGKDLFYAHLMAERCLEAMEKTTWTYNGKPMQSELVGWAGKRPRFRHLISKEISTSYVPAKFPNQHERDLLRSFLYTHVGLENDHDWLTDVRILPREDDGQDTELIAADRPSPEPSSSTENQASPERMRTPAPKEPMPILDIFADNVPRCRANR